MDEQNCCQLYASTFIGRRKLLSNYGRIIVVAAVLARLSTVLRRWVEGEQRLDNRLCGRPPQYAPAPVTLTFWPWKWHSSGFLPGANWISRWSIVVAHLIAVIDAVKYAPSDIVKRYNSTEALITSSKGAIFHPAFVYLSVC